ncbi:SMI1/KNR4 family protein [Gracilibacillus kekensis]|uniref:SMI1-KNR4 cell-wall n=1 Tax=Gracilibacillus kekensis TaxID=1027249 RepID=A0A1M7JZ04_9BACI|nr:SMI1/KNR4 family protein [Gracilibacillus kekensis]SHM57953.1 SMI1-KNR4 cell-wall [Gracilibacillus kekensis]
MNINAFGKATNESIKELEEYLGFLLPEDYKKFLNEFNGGTPKNRYSKFFVKELNQEVPLDVLYGIGVKSTFNLIECYEEFEEDMLPNSLIIGDDPGSGLIVLITDAENDGIYYWDHAFYFPQSNEEENTYKIADSFMEFINDLRNPEL